MTPVESSQWSKTKYRKTEMKNFPKEQSMKLEKLCRKYIDIFGDEFTAIGVNNFYEQRIRLNDQTPVFIKNYRTPYSDKAEIANQIAKMLKDDVIEPSISKYNNPILLVLKKPLPNSTQKRWRLVVDFRQLYKKMAADNFPLPRIDETLDRIGPAQAFSVLDFQSGFHQIGLHENSRDYTSFTTETGTYRFKRLPFGLKIVVPSASQGVPSGP